MMMVMATDGLCQVLNVRELVARRGFCEIGGKLVELARRRRIAGRLSRLGGALQVCGDLLGYLLVLRRVGLLKLLERVHQPDCGRQLIAVGLLRGGRCARAAQIVRCFAGSRCRILNGAVDNRLQVAAGKTGYGAAHGIFYRQSEPQSQGILSA